MNPSTKQRGVKTNIASLYVEFVVDITTRNNKNVNMCKWTTWTIWAPQKQEVNSGVTKDQ